MPFRKIIRIPAIIACLFSVCLPAVAAAQGGASIGQTFPTKETNLAAGALVSMEHGSSNIVLASIKNADRLVGITGASPLVEVSDGKGSAKVVTEGITSGLVSDINGDVKEGDRITASPIDGVGMKATQSTVVVGTAAADLSSVTPSQRNIRDQDGNQRTVHIGVIPVRVSVAAYLVPAAQTSKAPAFLQDVANGIAGKPVSTFRVLFASLLFILLFGVVTTLMYSAIRSSIISIGRNPFSEGALRRALLQTGLIIGGITLGGLVLVYLILRL